MKSIAKLIFLEVNFLKKTIALIGVILIAFVAALLSVISVLYDMPEGMYAGLDDYLRFFPCTVADVKGETSEEVGAVPVYASRNGLTRYAMLSAGAKSINTDAADGLLPIVRRGYAVHEGSGALKEYDTAKLEGEWPKADFEICLDADIAGYLGVGVGDSVYIAPDASFLNRDDLEFKELGQERYRVTAIYSFRTVAEELRRRPQECVVPAAYYYLALDETAEMDSVVFAFLDTRTLFRRYDDLVDAGYEASLGSVAESQYENINLAQAFFGAVAGVLGAMVLFILYSLIAIFYRQRRSQICRLKLLGATGSRIAAVYCSVAILLVVVSVVAGTAFSMAFNVYFMHLCARLFDKFSSNFVSHFRPAVSLVLLAAMAAFVLLLFAFLNRRVKNAEIAKEVRHE